MDNLGKLPLEGRHYGENGGGPFVLVYLLCVWY